VWACIRGHTEVVKLLLADERVPLAAQDYKSNEGLVYAVENQHMNELKLRVAIVLRLIVGFQKGLYTAPDEVLSFFTICAELPDELQQQIANMVCGSKEHFVLDRAINCAMFYGW
jgi:hypothetical protein